MRKIPTYRLLFVLADVIGIECALWFAVRLRLSFQGWSSVHIGTQQYQSLCFALLIIPCAYFWIGLYPGYGIGAVQRMRDRIYATTLVFGVLLAWNSFFASARWSRGILLLTMLFSCIIPALLDGLVRGWLGRTGLGGMPIVVLGAGLAGRALIGRLRSERSLGLTAIAVLDDDSSTWGVTIEDVPVVGPVSMASSYSAQAECAIIAMPDMNRQRLLELVQELKFTRVILVPDLAGVQTLWTVSRDFGGILCIEVRNNLLLRKNRMLKRALDFCIALPAFILTLPLMGFCALVIKITSSGPAFYRQEREGAEGQSISVWKLRTMFVNGDDILHKYLASDPDQAAHWHRHFKLKTDPRVLPVIGKLLRGSSIDELPQLWNVLNGEMSLVGPRPFPHYHLSSFPEDFRRLRRSVVPGLTGLWQVSERSDGDILVQQSLDTYYIRNWSVWLDIYILARTLRTVLLPRGAY